MNTNVQDLANFATGLQQQVIMRAELDEEGEFKQTAFVQIMLDYLADAGITENAEVCLYMARSVQISAYALSENGEALDVFIAIHKDSVPPETVLKTEVATAFKKAIAFFQRSCEGLHKEIEESSAAFDVAQQICQARNSTLTQVRFILITDGIVKHPPPLDQDLSSLRANYEIWDIERLYRSVTSGIQREAIEIDFEQAIGKLIPCLAQPDSTPEYAAYLAIFPASAIVEMYGKYGARLLERNVRSFLQARGKVNAGMRDTIRSEPQMFLAFNNGLSATAEQVTLSDMEGGGKGIKSVRDLQIVNGGQTTASIFNAVKKDKADVSQLFVQVKLTVLNDPQKMDTVVPLISRYANSQNKVQEADLAANDAYHRKVEELSRTIWAPAKEGTLRQTRWFYERARAQYQDERQRTGTSIAKLREFDTIHPKVQLFTKTDLAKSLVTWHMQPEIVSKGAQACFVWFMSNLEELEKEHGDMDTRGFERLAAKLILFRSAERLIKRKDMPFTGYWANLVTYSVARLVHETNGWLDLGRIWKEQKISHSMEVTLIETAKATWSHINQPPSSGANVTQYCKQKQCWTRFLDVPVYVSETLRAELLTAGSSKPPRSTATAKTVAGQENIQRILAVPPDQWFAIHTWAKDTGVFNGLQLNTILNLVTAISADKKITTQQANEGIKLLDAAVSSGYTLKT